MNSKKRLESFLLPSKRRELILALLQDVLYAATRSSLSDGTLLVTPDSEIIKITKRWNFPRITFLLEPEERGTNHAVQFAINWCISKHISSILIIPADIPLITSTDIDELLQIGNNDNSIIIAPSQRKDGTNAFYQSPPNLIRVWYGINSFQKNLQIISQSKTPYKILNHAAFALDIDLKEDLEQLQQSNVNSHTVKFVKSLNL